MASQPLRTCREPYRQLPGTEVLLPNRRKRHIVVDGLFSMSLAASSPLRHNYVTSPEALIRSPAPLGAAVLQAPKEQREESHPSAIGQEPELFRETAEVRVFSEISVLDPGEPNGMHDRDYRPPPVAGLRGRGRDCQRYRAECKSYPPLWADRWAEKCRKRNLGPNVDMQYVAHANEAILSTLFVFPRSPASKGLPMGVVPF
ncbi:hypothetical protein Daesc_010136 [Daldinia eschscholtzii]|uniref:Uncharacterized protein n=1 Tax=Daldinia eschscholtzii TaxID=292717 RepID=A0AAX6M6W0_9PEZI